MERKGRKGSRAAGHPRSKGSEATGIQVKSYGSSYYSVRLLSNNEGARKRRGDFVIQDDGAIVAQKRVS